MVDRFDGQVARRDIPSVRVHGAALIPGQGERKGILRGYVCSVTTIVLGFTMAAGMLAGCRNDPQNNPSKAATDAQHAPATPAEALQPGHSTLADGITFNREGYPEFVAGATGISVPEAFGRWTDGARATIEFARPLPAMFTLTITAAQRGDKPISVTVGQARTDLHFGRIWEFKTVSVPIVTDGTAKVISFDIPEPRSPKDLGEGDDTRRLGLALVSLKVEP